MLRFQRPLTPQPLLELAGTTAVWEDLHETGASGLRIASGGRRQQTYRIPPDLVRSLPAGQAVMVRQGHWGHIAMATPNPNHSYGIGSGLQRRTSHVSLRR